nr:integrase, catalytic region, zinc finger, CCHC-type, peptidase aspartic, catalytic [Tanacetum cinerariifolium]
MKKELFAHQETLSILSQAKETQLKFYKTCKDKEIDKVIVLENKIKDLDNIVYKTGQSVQTMNMLNRNCKMSFAKPEFLKKAQSVNPHLYDIGCYNDNLALMLALESDEVIRHERESRSKLNDLIRPFDYEKLNNLYDLFVSQREKSSAQRYFSKGVIPPTSVSRPQLKRNQMEDRVMLNNSQGKKQKVEDHRRNVKFSKNKTSLVEIILFIVDSGCSNHITRNLKLLTNFVEKFLGTVKLGNDQIAPILCYGDLVQGAVTIKRVYYIEGLNHNSFSIGQFCDADLEVAFWKSTCYICDLKGNDLLKGINHQTSVARTSEQNGVVERRNRTLVEAARTMLSAAKVPLLSPGPQCQENVPHAAGRVTTSNELDLLFSPMFDELLNGSTQVVSKSSAVTTADTLNQCEDDEFINIFCTPTQDRGETSSRHVDSSNMHTVYQRHPFEYRWMKYHLLEQVIRNPSQLVRTRHQLESDGEMCMFTLTVSRTKLKNIKEAMDDSTWIESM